MTTTSNKENPKSTIISLLHPELRKGQDTTLVERRNIIASVFIAMLISLAYAEMFVPVREAIRGHGLTASTPLLGFIFFFTSMRFFIGNQLHLLSENVVKMRGDMWLYDFIVITFQTLLLCFLGGLSAVDINRHVTIDFVDLLIVLYVVDIAWIFSQWLLGIILRGWRREIVPWAWAILNSVLVIAIVILRHYLGDIYSTLGLALLFGVNIAAFVLDIILIDYYDVI